MRRAWAGETAFLGMNSIMCENLIERKQRDLLALNNEA
jgi:hypothetical protein